MAQTHTPTHTEWNQKWRVENNHDGTVSLIDLMDTNLCLGYSQDRFASLVQLAHCNDTTHARFIFNTTDHTWRTPKGLCVDAGSNFGPPCEEEVNKEHAFCNINYSLDKRVDDLVSLIPVDQV